MYGYKNPAICPVCEDKLGYIFKDRTNSFLCKECDWFFTWNSKGELQKPVKNNNKKIAKCGCAIHRED